MKKTICFIEEAMLQKITNDMETAMRLPPKSGGQETVLPSNDNRQRRFFSALRYPLTARDLWELAMQFPDPARNTFGYFYPDLLLRECKVLVPRPIPRRHRALLAEMYQRWVNNQLFFCCQAAGTAVGLYVLADQEAGGNYA